MTHRPGNRTRAIVVLAAVDAWVFAMSAERKNIDRVHD
jgi:hypothetical protein